MRIAKISIALLAVLTQANVAFGGNGPQPVQVAALDAGGWDDGCDPCNACGPMGHHARRAAARAQQAYFNCGCNGSYKFPVPPLYTYHWPGMYSAQLMTDYHSPWRFPPLKPYVDEVPPAVVAIPNAARRVHPAAVVIEPAHTASPASFSDRVEQMLR